MSLLDRLTIFVPLFGFAALLIGHLIGAARRTLGSGDGSYRESPWDWIDDLRHLG